MKYDYKTIFDNIVRNVNEYLTNKNELIIENSNEKETYISCIKIINLLEILKETDETSRFYCDQIIDELVTLLTLLHINNSELKLLYIRKSAEWFMKWIYELTNKRDINAGFKTLKEHIKQQKLYIENKNLLDNLMKIFSETSNLLHTNIKKDTLEENFKNVLFSSTTNEEWRMIKNNLNNVFQVTLFFVKFYNNRYEMSQKIRFKKSLTKSQERYFLS
ncbi:hypothetical protein [Staphylococcus xylosus]|uniref:hypothetical protein n=1 Tax=Staphylococcus xylosus TaxID=1288 RepID=UPI002DBF1DD0|nr:hypothetical protein [Staphylococcus xylosus]MEB8101071.1 hypothetical protein [Staphylococcus xylosus]